MKERRHRYRVFLADNRTTILSVLLLMAAAGSFLTYTTHVSPGTTTVERQVASWESTAGFSHQATVTNETAVYSEGTVLQNRNTYFSDLTPELTGSFAYSYSATDGGNLTIVTQTDLLLRSADTDDGNGSVYWQSAERLSSTRAMSVSPSETISAPFTVNVSEANQRMQTIDQQFGGTPGEKQLFIVSEVTITGSRNGRPVNLSRSYRLRITPRGSIYSVSESGEFTASRGQTERTTVPADYGVARSVGGPMLLVLGLFGVGIVLSHHRYAPPVTETERQWVQYRQVRDEFEEWITAGRVPSDADGPPVVTVETLSGLVDLAIDTGARVVHDEHRDSYLILQDSRWFQYDIPSKPRIDKQLQDLDDDEQIDEGGDIDEQTSASITGGEESDDRQENESST